MILIADSGTTKTDWCVLDGLEVILRVKTSGMNPVLQSSGELELVVKKELFHSIKNVTDIDKIYFYGAGCLEHNKDVITEILRTSFHNADVEVYSDLTGAARALCGKQAGIVCILGTGSNTCLYNGERIIANVPPLGFIMGDEGSGAVLGRLLIADVFKKQLPEWLCSKFIERYNIDLSSLLQRVYHDPMPGRFLASVTPFLLENIEEPAIHRLVLNNFKSFFIRNITQYKDFRNYRINVTGSVGWFFRDVLKEAAEAMDCTLGVVTASPIEGLVDYHCRRG